MGRKRKRNRRKRKRGHSDAFEAYTESGMDSRDPLDPRSGRVWRTVVAQYNLCSHIVQPVKVADPAGEFTVYAGGKMDMDLKHMKDTDIQVCLADPSWSPYSAGFRGRLWYLPAPDGGVWPLEVYKQALEDIREAAVAGKKVLIYCLGGHGRTGTVLAGLLGMYEKTESPIDEVRKRYCKEAVEGWAQCELVYKAMGKPTPKRYIKEGVWGNWVDYRETGTSKYGTHTRVYYPANPTTGRADETGHPEAAVAGTMTVKTDYGSLQNWSDRVAPPVGSRLPWPPGKVAPTLDQVKHALTTRYTTLDRLSSLAKRVLDSSTFQVLHGYTPNLWWCYGDAIADTAGTRWECFTMYYGHESILDGHITMEYGRTRIAPTLTGYPAVYYESSNPGEVDL